MGSRPKKKRDDVSAKELMSDVREITSKERITSTLKKKIEKRSELSSIIYLKSDLLSG
jgi:hypothetical protein